MTRRFLTPFVLALAAAATCWPAAARAQAPLTLPGALERALAQHPDIAIQREAVQASAEAERRVRGAYDLLLRVDGRGRVRTDPVNSILSGAPEGALAPRATSVVGAASVQQLFSNGASLLASSSVSRDTSNSRLALLTPSWLSSLTVEFRQPLLQGREIDPVRRSLRLTAVDRTRSAAQLSRVASEVVGSVERAYWTLVAARRDLDVRRRTVDLARRQREDTLARIESGTAAESEVAAPDAEIARRLGEAFAAEETVARAEHALRALVAASPEDPVWQSAIDTPEPAPPLDAPPDIDASLAQAWALRPEIAEAHAGLDRQDVEIAAARDRLRPSLDFVAGYALRGLAGDRNPAAIPIGGLPIVVDESLDGALPKSWATLFTHRFADVSAGVSYSIPIGNTAAKAEVALAEIGRRQAESALTGARQRVALEVRNAVAAIHAASRRVETAAAGRVAAETQLQAEQDRYDAGITSSFFVLTRQNELAQAELAETAALVDYRKAHAEYLRATGQLLERRGVSVAVTP